MLTKNLLNKTSELVTLLDQNFDLLLSAAKQKEYNKGECLLNEGQQCDYLYFVESGYLRSYYSRDVKDITIDFTFEGNFTCNIKSLKLGQPSQYNIVAGEKSMVTLFNKNDLLDLYSRSPDIELLCRKILGNLLIESKEHVDFYQLNTPLQRYDFLMENKPEMIKKLSVTQLASYIGVARETLSRIRKQ